MRSIGKVNIKKLNKIVDEEFKKLDLFGQRMYGKQLKECIEERIPSDWYDIWESAWAEINRLIDDRISQLTYVR